MSVPAASTAGGKRRGAQHPESTLRRGALGLEAEFSLTVDGTPTPPEHVFSDPRDFLGSTVLHRVGTSYHLPNGGAVYFDTGVVEIVTPPLELERGGAVRAVRSLWENIGAVRTALDRWEQRTGRRITLGGFSTHYNVSVKTAPERRRRLDRLARLLTYVLPAPVMLLAANRRSTGIGVRPRVTRVEVTADFTPDPTLQVATATLIAGVVREVARWPVWTMREARRRGLPIIAGFNPQPHTSRRGWLANDQSYPRNPFTTPPDQAAWNTAGASGTRSLRAIAQDVFRHFRPSVGPIADPFTLRLIGAVLNGGATSLLDLPDRPVAYEDVGRLCAWRNVFPARLLRRSRYERVLMLTIAGRPVTIGGELHHPAATRGWSDVVLSRAGGGTRVMSIDDLLPYLDRWEGR